MDLPVSFSFRFKTTLAGIDFIGEAECANREEARAQFAKVLAQSEDIEFIAGLIYLELAKPKGGCYQLDEDSESIFVDIVKTLKLGAEHFLNESIGSYDRYTNRVTPADLGINFPDGTIRIVWHEKHALLDFDRSLEIAKGAAELLLQVQDIPYCRPTEEEFEECDNDGAKDRRIEILFKAGFWPADDGSFEDELKSNDEIRALIAEYCGKAVPQPQSA